VAVVGFFSGPFLEEAVGRAGPDRGATSAANPGPASVAPTGRAGQCAGFGVSGGSLKNAAFVPENVRERSRRYDHVCGAV